MEYVFLGGVYPRDREDEVFKNAKGKLSFAANKHQWSMIQGIEKNIGKAVSIVNAYFLPTYPNYKEKVIRRYTWSHVQGARDVTIGYMNYRGIRNIGQARGCYRELKRYLDKHLGKEIVVFVYTMRYCQMKAVHKLKKRGYKFHACLIVPDVPSILAQYGGKKDLFSQILNIYNLNATEKYTVAMNSFVLLSEPMKEVVNIGGRPYCIVDGLFTEYCDLEDEQLQDGLKRIIYTGSLHKEYGICHLIEEFKKISGQEYRLIIAGNGNAVDEVNKATFEDVRIQYVGLLNHEEVRNLQQKATLLVNPRPLQGIDAKYSFPSKTIEYMLSGKPVLMNRLPGMDPIYEKYLFTPEQCGCQDFSEAMKYICELSADRRKEIALEARKYIIENKNNIKQTEMILNMLRSCKFD